MRLHSFSGVKITWLGIKLHRDLARSPRAVRWKVNSASRQAVSDGIGGYVSIRHPPAPGSFTCEIMGGSRTAMQLKAIAQASDLVSNIPAPVVIRNTVTSETITLLQAQLRGVPPQALGSRPVPVSFVWDFRRAIEIFGDLDAASVGT